MRNSLILAGLAAALLSGTALAADLPRRAEPPVFTPIPVFAWTGAYLGINAGYAYTEGDTLRTTGIGALQANVVNDLRRPAVGLPQDGFSVGGQGGYNFQLTPGTGLVVGVEADAQYMDLQRSRAETIFRPAFNPNVLTNVYRADLDFLGTLRGRIGYAFDRVLVYGTGGFAYGTVSQSVTFQTGAPVTYAGARSGVETGYAYGGGIEYALPTDSFLNVFNSSAVTLKGEYLRYDLGSRTLFVGTTGGPGVGYNVTYRTEGAIARAGLNFKFGSY
ncbi:outer membrane protein [Methylorubrum zatmanii]|uniref:Outer membrane protein n=1 Tax=Methylorubrum zatmanii TaxID=29429 RepID=A0ABW1WV27_9HYPH|nr:porin family protein [Methylorubrum zatmanii]MBD8907790.1 porin [Methylorubrum zatmanii]